MRCLNKTCRENRNNWCMLDGITPDCPRYVVEEIRNYTSETSIQKPYRYTRTDLATT